MSRGTEGFRETGARQGTAYADGVASQTSRS